MAEYWLISAPGDKTCQQTWETMNNVTSKQNSLSSNFKFHIPDLKVGTLDQLVGLSDDLGKLDAYVENITRKVASYLGEVLEDQRDKLHENLMANNKRYEEATRQNQLNRNDCRCATAVVHKQPQHNLCCCCCCWTFRRQKRRRSVQAPKLSTTTITTTANAPAVMTNDTLRLCTQGLGPPMATADDTAFHNDDDDDEEPNDVPRDPPKVPPPLTINNNVTTSLGAHHHHHLPNPNHHLDHHQPKQSHHHHNPHHTTTTTTTNQTQPHQQADEQYSPSCHESLNHSSTGSERESDSACCACDAASCSGSTSSECAAHDAPPPPTSGGIISDACDWWFLRNRGSHKSNSRSRSSSIFNLGSHGGHRSHRSSPVSSCCGSSQGRCSPDVDFEGPPQMPLSPADLPSYITRFQWDMAKYPIKQSLRNIADIISKQVGQIDADLKNKATVYNNLKGNLQNLEKKQTGSLLIRNLADLVKKEHFILDSEYLTTLLVIVPKNNVQDWTTGYEKITDMIVPRSSSLITQDTEYALFNVSLFKKVVEEFKLHAREKKFVVRDFVYNEEELAAGKNEITKLVTDKKKQFGPLVRWLKVNFSETFCAWIHVKALRVFVESVLRYGLPVNFQAILLQPNKKSTKRLRDVLNQLYSHLDGSAAAPSGNVDNVDIPGLGFGQSEYFPYVYYKLNIDMVETKI